MSYRRLVVIALIVAAIAAASLSLYRDRLEAQALSGLEQWAQDQRARGRTVEWDQAEISGFPAKIRVTLINPAAAWPGGASWRAESASVWAWVFAPDDLHIDVAGHMAILNAEGGLAVSAKAENASLKVTARNIDFHAHHLDVNGTAIADLAASLDRTGGQSRRFAVAARDAVFANDMRVIMAEMSGRILGDFPEQASVAAIAQWSNSGGTVEVDRIALDWPPVGLEGDGTVGLDGAGMIAAAFSAHIRGAPVLLERLNQDGAVAPSAASAAGMAAALMSKPDAKGRPTLSLPISIQDGGLFLGPVRAAEIPSIPWADFAGRR